MKKFEFETSKGKFILVDTPLDAYNLVLGTHCIGVKTNENLEKDSNGFYHIYSNGLFFGDIKIKIELIGFLKQITEEQASEIVDSVVKDSYGKEVGFKNYPFEGHPFNYPILGTAIQSLNSLIESKGINLFENTYCIDDVGEILYKEAEQNTFYNPYIFKLA